MEDYNLKEIMERNHQEMLGRVSDITQWVKSLAEEKKVQNGRVGKSERDIAWLKGGLAVIAVVVVPLIISVVTAWLNKK